MVPEPWATNAAGRAGLVDVEDFLQRVDIRIDEQATVDFDRGISAQMKRIRMKLLGAHELVVDMKPTQKTGDEAGLLLFTTGEKPYGHPPLLHPPLVVISTVLNDVANGTPQVYGRQINKVCA